MAKSDGAGMLKGPERPLLLLLHESGDALEATSPPFDASAGAARLREAARGQGLLRPGGIPEDDLAVTGTELEEEAPPFDVEAGAARLRQAACARGLLSSGSEGSAEQAARRFRVGKVPLRAFRREATQMVSRTRQSETLGLAALALLGIAGGSVFAVLAGEGGKGHLRSIILGVVCATILVSVTAANRFIDMRFLRTGVAARERAVEERERAALSREKAEWGSTEAQIEAESHVVTALRARLSPALYCLGKIAAASSGTVGAPLIGSLTQAIVAAAIEHRNPEETRRSVFFTVKGDLMECVSYAGYEGRQDAESTIFRNSPDDPVGQHMFRLLGEGEALLIRDVGAVGLPVKFPSHRSYQAIIAAAVMAGESPCGILTLDASQADSLGRPDLEIMKTLASLLGIGLAVGVYSNKATVHVAAQGNGELP